MVEVGNLESSLAESISITSSTPDEATKKSLDYQEKYNEASLTNYEQNRLARKKYSHRIFLITIIWLGSTMLILLGVGFEIMKLPDSVLLALLGSSSVNVLGFFAIVIQYLFNKDKST